MRVLQPSALPEWAAGVTVAFCALDAGGEDESLLDAEEQARASRFRFPELQVRFRQSHAFLRRVLGEVLGEDPKSFRFVASERGRPSLPGSAWDFNLSHSGAWAALAVAKGAQVGIDVEVRRELRDMLEVSKLVFTPTEHATVAQAQGEARALAFFRGWTRKEALLKASGLGISEHLQTTQVTLSEAALVERVPAPMAGTSWSLCGLPAPAGAEAALALGRKP